MTTMSSQPTPTALLTTLFLLLVLTTLTITNLTITRLHRILTRPAPRSQLRVQSNTPFPSDNPQTRNRNRKGHLLILLGSGGHTSEMIAVLHTLGFEYIDARFERRTWVVSSGDGFSAARAAEFEREMEGWRRKRRNGNGESANGTAAGYGSGSRDEGENGQQEPTWNIVTVRRARKVHQSLLTTPISALGCLVDCLGVLRGKYARDQKNGLEKAHSGEESKHTDKNNDNDNYKYDYNYPDLILTNGPGTGVIMVVASLLLLFIGVAPIRINNYNNRRKQTTSTDTLAATKTPTDPYSETQTPIECGSMRSIYIESWARVKSLSLSGRILRFLASRVLVQWRGVGEVDATKLEGEGVGREGDGGVGGESGSGSMRIQKRREGRSTGVDYAGPAYVGSIWPRKTEYIGAVVT